MLVFPAKIMEKESDHLFDKFSSQYFIVLKEVTFHTLFSSIKKQLTFNGNFWILKIKHFHFIVFTLPRHPKGPMVYGKKYTFKFVHKLSAKL